ncbi:MAG: ferrochelatase [Propionibacteriales bacterium]|nr:ferrochelatase [Propionibacteriales bacterium]
MTAEISPYEALLLVSFGGPERPEDVVPFLQNVTRGKQIPPERLRQVGEHYFRFGGRSPINDQNRELKAAIEKDLADAGLAIPVYWGNRNWDPYLTDAIAAMRDDGVRRAACFVTSACASYSGCRQYRENLFEASAAVEGAPRLDRLRHYYNHPGFVTPFVEATLTALEGLPPGAALVFVTHSIPTAMNDGSGPDGGAYLAQHQTVARSIAQDLARRTGTEPAWDLVFCSRSGSPHVPWLGPDVDDHLEVLADRGVPGVALVPIGFVSDHMEVVYDLDTQARETAGRLGLPIVRAATPGTDRRFVSMVRELLLERAAVERGATPARTTVAGDTPAWDVCPAGCCPNPRSPRPALCGMDGDA